MSFGLSPTEGRVLLAASQLGLILDVIRSSLATVTSLRLNLQGPAIVGQLSDDPYGLLQLSGCCPAVRQLAVGGRVPRSLLRMLGSTVTELEVLGARILPAAAEGLPELLPLLKQVTVKEYTPHPFNDDPMFDFSKMCSVERFSIPSLRLEAAEWWACLPPNLQRLELAGVLTPPPAAVVGNLRVLHLEPKHLFCLCSAKGLAGLLRAAPRLQRVECHCEHISILSGLEGHYHDMHPDGAGVEALAADVTQLSSWHEANAVSWTFKFRCFDITQLDQFLEAGPVTSGFTHVMLATRLEDWEDEPYEPLDLTADLLQLVATGFPDMHTLELRNIEACVDISKPSASLLGGLRCLSLISCAGVTCNGLTALIHQLPELRELHCGDCAGMGKEQGDVISSAMSACGRVILVEVWPDESEHELSDLVDPSTSSSEWEEVCGEDLEILLQTVLQ